MSNTDNLGMIKLWGRAYWHTKINKHSKTQAYTDRDWCVNKG
jgi:hypothetical protein